jgi:hypothetical protein
MRVTCGEPDATHPVVELADSRLRALCRPVRALGIFARAHWREWQLSDLVGFWVGRIRLFPPQVWMFETNTAHLTAWLVVRVRTGGRFYVREFGRLQSSGELVAALRASGVREFDDPAIAQ